MIDGKLVALSLGWGVQSWTIAAMAALDELPKPDVALHADTTWEHNQTYKFAVEWTPWLEAHGVKVVTVSDPETAALVTTKMTMIPAYADNGKPGGGRLNRQCTERWKIRPIRRFIRSLRHELRLRHNLTQKPNDIPLHTDISEVRRIADTVQPFARIDQWMGITVDEIERTRISDVNYIVHCYPLLDLRMTRIDCMTWLRKHGLPIPPSSSCTFCPYHSPDKWIRLKQKGGPDWEQALEIDNAIRHVRPKPVYVHRALKPLDEAARTPEDVGATQLALDFDTFDMACDSGHCFL